MNIHRIVLLLGLVVGMPAVANQHETASLSQGEVRNIDVNGRKITLRHGLLKGVGMPPMTMLFDVDDSASLDGVRVGDKVMFQVERHGSRYVVTEITHD